MLRKDGTRRSDGKGQESPTHQPAIKEALVSGQPSASGASGGSESNSRVITATSKTSATLETSTATTAATRSWAEAVSQQTHKPNYAAQSNASEIESTIPSNDSSTKNHQNKGGSNNTICNSDGNSKQSESQETECLHSSKNAVVAKQHDYAKLYQSQRAYIKQSTANPETSPHKLRNSTAPNSTIAAAVSLQKLSFDPWVRQANNEQRVLSTVQLFHFERLDLDTDLRVRRYSSSESSNNWATAGLPQDPPAWAGLWQHDGSANVDANAEVLSLLDSAFDKGRVPDVIGSSQSLKALFSMPYTDQPVSVFIHRVGRAILVESGEEMSTREAAQLRPSSTSLQFLVHEDTEHSPMPRDDRDSPRNQRPLTHREKMEALLHERLLEVQSISHEDQSEHANLHAEGLDGTASVSAPQPNKKQPVHAPNVKNDEKASSMLHPSSSPPGTSSCSTSSMSTMKKQEQEQPGNNVAPPLPPLESPMPESGSGTQEGDPSRSSSSGNNSSSSHSSAWNAFRRTLSWKFDNVEVVVGSKLMVFQDPESESGNLSVRLHDASERLSGNECLDFYLENRLAGVQQFALCLHTHGRVRDWRLYPTEDIPRLEGHHVLFEDNRKLACAFSPQVLEHRAAQLLAFLRERLVDGHTYWLFKNANSSQVHLCQPASSNWMYSMAMLSCRMALSYAQKRRKLNVTPPSLFATKRPSQPSPATNIGSKAGQAASTGTQRNSANSHNKNSSSNNNTNSSACGSNNKTPSKPKAQRKRRGAGNASFNSGASSATAPSYGGVADSSNSTAGDRSTSSRDNASEENSNATNDEASHARYLFLLQRERELLIKSIEVLEEISTAGGPSRDILQASLHDKVAHTYLDEVPFAQQSARERAWRRDSSQASDHSPDRGVVHIIRAAVQHWHKAAAHLAAYPDTESLPNESMKQSMKDLCAKLQETVFGCYLVAARAHLSLGKSEEAIRTLAQGLSGKDTFDRWFPNWVSTHTSADIVQGFSFLGDILMDLSKRALRSSNRGPGPRSTIQWVEYSNNLRNDVLACVRLRDRARSALEATPAQVFSAPALHTEEHSLNICAAELLVRAAVLVYMAAHAESEGDSVLLQETDWKLGNTCNELGKLLLQVQAWEAAKDAFEAGVERFAQSNARGNAIALLLNLNHLFRSLGLAQAQKPEEGSLSSRFSEGSATLEDVQVHRCADRLKEQESFIQKGTEYLQQARQLAAGNAAIELELAMNDMIRGVWARKYCLGNIDALGLLGRRFAVHCAQESVMRLRNALSRYENLQQTHPVAYEKAAAVHYHLGAQFAWVAGQSTDASLAALGATNRRLTRELAIRHYRLALAGLPKGSAHEQCRVELSSLQESVRS
mmetsp:Transcript_18015/g.35457  ORF Transcript_18015/g.35457 Transcript_18015/m.35457 type:complete len:1361 (-) Transcript_18015:307-4389(-)